jgi:DNA-binding protein H-NS
MKDINLHQYSEEDLVKLREQIDKFLINCDIQKRQEALRAAEIASEHFGFTLKDLLGPIKNTTVSVPKFRNPATPSQTWSGRGRPPQWFKDAIGDGMTEVDLLIKSG